MFIWALLTLLMLVKDRGHGLVITAAACAIWGCSAGVCFHKLTATAAGVTPEHPQLALPNQEAVQHAPSIHLKENSALELTLKILS